MPPPLLPLPEPLLPPLLPLLAPFLLRFELLVLAVERPAQSFGLLVVGLLEKSLKKLVKSSEAFAASCAQLFAKEAEVGRFWLSR